MHQRETAISYWRNSIISVALLASVMLIVIAHMLIRVVYTSHEKLVTDHLQATLNSTAEQINVWYQQKVSAMKVLLSSAEGQALITQIAAERGTNQSTVDRFQQWLSSRPLPIDNKDYAIIDLDNKVLSSSNNTFVGSTIADPESFRTLRRTMLYGMSFSHPTPYRYYVGDPTAQPASNGVFFQFLCALVGEIRAKQSYFCLGFLSEVGFYPIFINSRVGATGEVYAINDDGVIVTPSRFIPTGIWGSNGSTSEQEFNRLYAREPTTEKLTEAPFTRLAGELLAHKKNVIQIGYPDYRGITVVGSANWNSNLEIGLIAEQDFDEAFASYTLSRNIIIVLTISAIGLIVLLSVNYLFNRRSLAIRESRFRSLIENIPTPIYMKGLDGQFNVVNSDFCRMVTLHRDDILGSTNEELPLPSWLQPVLRHDTEFNRDYSVNDQHIDLQIDPKTPSHFRMLRFPIVGDEQAGPGGVATVLVDTTARVLASNRLKEINQNLENLVDQRTTELVEAKEAAEAASKAKAHFLANMSHEIRTPLNAIIGLANVGLKKKIDGILRDYLQKIRGSAQHLLQVMNDILDFSRLEAGKYHLNVSEFRLQDIIDKAIDLIWAKAEAKGLEIKIETDDSIPFVLVGDPLRLGQILINFTSNAVKFTDSGSICIRANKRFQDANQVGLEFEVEDTGIGIDTDTLNTLFQPFQQADGGSSRAYEGSGLGLVICKSLAKLMNGRIEVDSTPGKGSCFRLLVSLNYHGDLSALSPANTGEPEFKPSEQIKSNILLVEDNALNQEVAEALIREFGAKVTTVASGPEAIRIFADNDFDIVLMDIRMPGMDGIEVTKILRATAKGTGVPIIAMTANVQAGDRDHYLNSGMDDYIEKPINPEQLYSTLRHWAKTSRNNATSADKAANGNSTTTMPHHYALLQHEGVDTELALRHLLYNHALYHRLLIKFLETYYDLPEKLADLATQQRNDQLLDTMHTLGSQAGTLGFNALRDCVRQVEGILRAGVDDDSDKQLQHHMSQLRQQLLASLATLQNYLAAVNELQPQGA